MTLERTVVLANSDLPDLDSGLAWVVQAFDREFSGASMVKISVEQVLVSADGDAWESQWTASISGLVKETDG